MKKYILYTVISLFSCSINTMETTQQELTEFDINKLSDDQLGDILSQQLKQDDLIPSIRRLWKQREVDKRFKTLITPHNIVLWIKKRDIGIASLSVTTDSRVKGPDLTPIMQALHLNDMEVAKILLNGGAVNEKNNEGDTPLIAGRQDIDQMKLLLSTPGVDINAQNNQGETALFRAAFLGRAKDVELFLEYCPNIHVKLYDNYLHERLRGKSTLDWAKKSDENTACIIRGYAIGHKSCNKCKQQK